MTRIPVAVSLVLVSLLAVPLHAADVLVPAGSDWLFLDDGSDQGTAWQTLAFSDAGWSSGTAPLGYGGDGPLTPVGFGPDSDDKYTTTYFRRHFDVPDPSIYSEALLRVRRDDGAVVYLNGTEIYRTGMPSGTVDASTFASATASAADEYNYFSPAVDASLLVTGDNVLAVELHQRSLTSSDVSFDASLEAGDLPFITRGPYLQLATSTSTVVRWRTHVASAGRVWFGPAPGSLSSFVDSPVFDKFHEVTLSGFLPGETVYYAVGTPSDVLAGGDVGHVFRTAPAAGSTGPVRVWILGDSGEADENADAVRDAWLGWSGDVPPDVWLMLGDNAYDDGSNSQYQAAVFDRYPTLLRRTAVWPTRGNHEDSLATYTGNFTLPTLGEAGGVASGSESYYSFDHGNVHFVCLDSDASSKAIGGAMYTWADADLSATTQDWIIAFWHHPPYTKGSHDSDTEDKLLEMRTNLLPLLESHGVDLVLGGHSHAYERSMLVDGHYGLSTSFGPEHQRDTGDGDPLGDGAYDKASMANQGAVFVVAGSGSKLSDGTLDHPTMVFSEMELGSLVLDIAGDVLTATFLRETGAVDDTFTIVRHESWADLGNGLAGLLGVPQLSGDGPLVANEPAALLLTSGRPLAVAALVMGLSEANVPLKGGVLVPTPDVIVAGLPLDGAGAITLPTSWPAGVPAGVSTYHQMWISDAAGPQGFAASNALEAVSQ